MTVLEFTVDAEVQGKMRHRSGGGRQYTPARTVAYEKAIRAACLDAMRRKGVARLEGALRLTVVARFVPPQSASKKRRAAMLAGDIRPTKKPDGSNHVKAIEDAIQDQKKAAGLFADDSQIVELMVSKVYAEHAGSDVRVEQLWPTTSNTA